jgi:hypothetical protein
MNPATKADQSSEKDFDLLPTGHVTCRSITRLALTLHVSSRELSRLICRWQAVKVELVLNLKTAKTLGITFPLSMLGRANEVVE